MSFPEEIGNEETVTDCSLGADHLLLKPSGGPCVPPNSGVVRLSLLPDWDSSDFYNLSDIPVCRRCPGTESG